MSDCALTTVLTPAARTSTTGISSALPSRLESEMPSASLATPGTSDSRVPNTLVNAFSLFWAAVTSCWAEASWSLALRRAALTSSGITPNRPSACLAAACAVVQAALASAAFSVRVATFLATWLE